MYLASNAVTIRVCYACTRVGGGVVGQLTAMPYRSIHSTDTDNLTYLYFAYDATFMPLYNMLIEAPAHKLAMISRLAMAS